jgi:hypothetical protein
MDDGIWAIVQVTHPSCYIQRVFHSKRGRQDFFLCQQLMQVSPAKYSEISISEGCCLTAPRNCTRLGCLTLARTSVSCQKYFSTILSVNKDGQMVLTSTGGPPHIALLISPDEPLPITLSLRSNSEGGISQSMLCDAPDPSRALTQASFL